MDEENQCERNEKGKWKTDSEKKGQMKYESSGILSHAEQ